MGFHRNLCLTLKCRLKNFRFRRTPSAPINETHSTFNQQKNAGEIGLANLTYIDSLDTLSILYQT